MSKTIPLPKVYLEKILKPANKITDSCILKIRDDVLYTICSTDGNSIVLYARTKLPITFENDVRLNLISIKKLITGLSILGSDGEFSLIVSDDETDNKITCQMVASVKNKTHFDYHLVDDAVIKESTLKREKIVEVYSNRNLEFLISSDVAKQILSAASYASEVSKVYFTIIDGVVYAQVKDDQMQNTDNFTIPVTDKWTGAESFESFCISLEVFKNLAAAKNDITTKLNTEDHKVVIFSVTDDEVELKYIVAFLVK